MPQFKFNTISRTDIESSVGGAQMINAIDYDGPNNLLVSGCAGSGKTTVSVMRGERLINLKKNVVIVTFQDLLTTSLINIATPALANNIYKYHSWYYKQCELYASGKNYLEMLEDLKDCAIVDEFIIDEGQNFFSDIHQILMDKCIKITIGADNAQKIHEGLSVEQIKEKLLKKGSLTPIPLQYNYRNTYEIYNFARYFLPFNERANNDLAIDKIPKGKSAPPTVFLIPDQDTNLAQLYTLLRDAGDRNIAILVYHIDEVADYYNKITDMGINCSMHHTNNHVGYEVENVLITTFKSAQGLEFQTVIMPNMETAMNKAFKTREHYYIGCTRAKESLFLLINGNNLPWYFEDFAEDSFELKIPEKQSAPKKVIPPAEGEDFDLPF